MRATTWGHDCPAAVCATITWQCLLLLMSPFLCFCLDPKLGSLAASPRLRLYFLRHFLCFFKTLLRFSRRAVKANATPLLYIFLSLSLSRASFCSLGLKHCLVPCTDWAKDCRHLMHAGESELSCKPDVGSTWIFFGMSYSKSILMTYWWAAFKMSYMHTFLASFPEIWHQWCNPEICHQWCKPSNDIPTHCDECAGLWPMGFHAQPIPLDSLVIS